MWTPKNLCQIMSCCEMPTVLISLGSARTPQKHMRVKVVFLNLSNIVFKCDYATEIHSKSMIFGNVEGHWH